VNAIFLLPRLFHSVSSERYEDIGISGEHTVSIFDFYPEEEARAFLRNTGTHNRT
jgi:hypothetical protein